MRCVLLGALGAGVVGAATVAVLGLGGVEAAERGREFAFDGGGPRAWSRFSPEDRQAFADARLAALRAGLRLNAEQERLWPPVEEAVRNLAKVRREGREAMRAQGRDAVLADVPGTLRAMADRGAARAEALRRLADASGPLYATLDEGQKRRALVLARPMGRWGHRMMEHGPGRGRD